MPPLVTSFPAPDLPRLYPRPNPPFKLGRPSASRLAHHCVPPTPATLPATLPATRHPRPLAAPPLHQHALTLTFVFPLPNNPLLRPLQRALDCEDPDSLHEYVPAEMKGKIRRAQLNAERNIQALREHDDLTPYQIESSLPL